MGKGGRSRNTAQAPVKKREQGVEPLRRFLCLGNTTVGFPEDIFLIPMAGSVQDSFILAALH